MTRLILALTMTSAAWGQASPPTHSVTFLVIDENGRSLSGWKVTQFNARRDDAAIQFNELSANKVPDGVYHYVLTGPSPRPEYTPRLGGDTQVYGYDSLIVKIAHADLVNGVAIDRIFRVRNIPGKVEPAPAISPSEPVWVNIHSMFTANPDINLLVNARGEFFLPFPLEGSLIISVICNGEILYSRPYVFDPRSGVVPITLKLPETSPVTRIKPN